MGRVKKIKKIDKRHGQSIVLFQGKVKDMTSSIAQIDSEWFEDAKRIMIGCDGSVIN